VLRADKDPVGALALVEPLLGDERLRSRVWALVAEAREKQGNRTGALAAARTAVAASAVDFTARVVHQRLASRAGGSAESAEATTRLIDARPRNARELRAVLAALRSAGHSDVHRFRASLERWGLSGWDEQLEEVDAEIDLRAAPHDLERADRLVNPLPAVARVLDERRAWARLAAYADEHPPAVTASRAAAVELRKAAARALTAGFTAPAERLAGHALALNPDDSYAQETWANAADQLRVVRDGWTPAVRASGPRYAVRPDAVLSVLAQSLPHQSGGYATRSHGVLTGLDALGWDVEAVTRLGFPYDRWAKGDTREVPAYDVVDGIRYSRILEGERRQYPQYPLASYVDRYATAIQQHARRHRPALLHASSFHVNGLATQLAAARLGVPYVYEMRGLEDLMKVSRDSAFEGSDRRRFLDTVEGAVCLGAERVFVITEALKREMAARGVPAEKLVVLPNGVHTELFQPRERDAELEASLGLRGKTVIGYAGGLVDYEGLDLLLESVALLDRDDFHVVVVGDGHYESTLHALAERLGVGHVVTFTGRVPHALVPRYLSLFDVAPFPRLPLPVCEMISPIKPFESMASGKAVVVSSVAALTEIVQDHTTGLVFEKGSPGDLARVLGELLDSPELRVKLGESARTWVTNDRDWSTIVDILDATYREILA
jgi:glycosyltransferase involved in cell wall biosynthesis